MPSATNTKLSGASYSLGLNNDAFINGLKKAELALSAWGEAIKNHGRNVASAGALMMAPFVGALSSATNFAREITRIAAETGIGVEALSMLDTMAQLTGNSLQQLANVYIKLTDAAGKLWRGNAEVASAFGELRLTWQQVRGMDPETLFTEVIDRLAALKNPVDRATLGFKLFGEQFREVLPLLNQGTTGLRELQAKIDKFKLRTSAEDIRIIKEFGDGLTLLWASFRQLGTEVAIAVMPVFRPLVEAISRGLLVFRQWIRENADLARTIATVAVALTIYGGSMLALGVTIKVVALQVAMFHGLLLPLRASVGLLTAAYASSKATLGALSLAVKAATASFTGLGTSVGFVKLVTTAVGATLSALLMTTRALVAGIWALTFGMRAYFVITSLVVASMYALYVLSGLVTAVLTSGIGVWAVTTAVIGLLAIAHETNNLALTSTIALTILAATVLLNYHVAVMLVTSTLGAFGVTVAVTTAALVAGYAAVRALTTSYGVLRGAMIATAIASSAFAITVLITKSLLLGIAAAAVVVTIAFGLVAKGIALAALAMKGWAAAVAIFAVVKAAVLALVSALWLALSPILFFGLKLVVLGTAIAAIWANGASLLRSAWGGVGSFFSRLFSNIASIGRDAFAGIAASIQMGDIEGAMNVAILGLKAAWHEFFEWLRDGWSAMEPHVTAIWEKVMKGIKEVWGKFFSFLIAFFEIAGIVPEGTAGKIDDLINGQKLTDAQKKANDVAKDFGVGTPDFNASLPQIPSMPSPIGAPGPATVPAIQISPNTLSNWVQMHGAEKAVQMLEEALNGSRPDFLAAFREAMRPFLPSIGPEITPAMRARRDLQIATEQAVAEAQNMSYWNSWKVPEGGVDPGMLMKATSMGTFNGAIAGLLAPDSIDKEQLRQLELIAQGVAQLNENVLVVP